MENKNEKIKNVISLAFNLAIIVVTCYAMSRFFISRGDGNMQVSGFKSLKYFTNLSNCFAALASLICIPYNIRNMKKGTNHFPKAFYLTKFYLKHSKNTPASTGGEMNCCNKLTNEHLFAIICTCWLAKATSTEYTQTKLR